MARYMVLYQAKVNARELMAQATTEQMQASIAEWIRWKEAAEKTATIEFGLPLQAVGHITQDGVTESTSSVSGYAIIEGSSKEAVLELLKTHPHLQRSDASLDVLEMLPMPGI